MAWLSYEEMNYGGKNLGWVMNEYKTKHVFNELQQKRKLYFMFQII